MVGKIGSKRKDGTRYRNYWCSRARSSRAACSTYNGHAAAKLEKAILDYLDRVSIDPDQVRGMIEAADKSEVESRSGELDRVEKELAGIASDFLKHLDLHKKGIINEAEFQAANESIRGRKELLEGRRAKLTEWVSREADRASAADVMPGRIRSFLEDFQELDVRQQKGHLQTILKAAQVHRDGGIDLEFRT